MERLAKSAMYFSLLRASSWIYSPSPLAVITIAHINHITQQRVRDRKSYYKATRHYQLPQQVRAKSSHSSHRCKRIKKELEDKVHTKKEKPRKKNRMGPGIFCKLEGKSKPLLLLHLPSSSLAHEGHSPEPRCFVSHL
jgi:hypothetical protein